ncbi:MAG: VirD4-like conjugal transfer protein, CD1115 family [Ignavibacteriales bacterium]
MKFKFRAEPKDWLIFIIFCIILLYMVAIAILNISSFAEFGLLHGFNPFPAFTSEYIGPTLVFFFFALIAIMMSVSSYFFEREKGFGLASGAKKEKGYSRWSTDREMKKELRRVYPAQEKADAAGIPLINNGKEIWVDDGEYHSLVIGATGSGKTEMMVQPMVKILAKKGESMIITDPKGEIYERNANELREKGYNIVLLNFREPQKGNSWNPLSLPYKLYREGNPDKANELLDDLAMNILYDEAAQGQDPFWEKTSADYFAGLSLALFEDAKEDEINLNSINLMTTVGEEKYGNSTYMKEYYSDKSQTSPAYINVASTLMAPNETKSSILSVFKQKIKLFSSRENLSEMLSRSDFDMKDIGRHKTAVFIVVQDEKKTYHSLVTIFIKQCYETLIDVAQENGGKLPFRTNFILDEFANMPPLKDVTTMVTAARSRAIRFTFIIQNFAQLYQVYGKENGETIKGNCGNIIYLISSEIAALEEISKMCGEEKSKDKDKTVSTPLVTVSDLQRLKKWSIVVIRTRMMPYKTEMTPNFKLENMNAWGKKYDKSIYPIRTKSSVEVFDLKKYVDEKKKDKENRLINSLSDHSSGSGSSQNIIPPMHKNNDMGSLNMDDLVKRIDAKIAELEEEDRREAEKRKVESEAKTRFVTPVQPKEEPKIITIPSIPTLEEKKSEKVVPKLEDEFKVVKRPEIKKEVKPEIEPEIKVQPVTEKVVETVVEKKEEKPQLEKNPIADTPKNKPVVTDDQFFDDFFSEDE